MAKEHTLWSNIDLDFEDWRAELEAEYPDDSEDELRRKMWEINDDYLDDERRNLNIAISERIIVIARLGLWDGEHVGYRELAGNIRNCLGVGCGDYRRYYVDKVGDLCCTDMHHDGTNHYTFRAYKNGVSVRQKKDFIDKIYNGTVTRADITRVTRRLGDDIAAVYGFDIYRGVRAAA